MVAEKHLPRKNDEWFLDQLKTIKAPGEDGCPGAPRLETAAG